MTALFNTLWCHQTKINFNRFYVRNLGLVFNMYVCCIPFWKYFVLVCGKQHWIIKIVFTNNFFLTFHWKTFSKGHYIIKTFKILPNFSHRWYFVNCNSTTQSSSQEDSLHSKIIKVQRTNFMDLHWSELLLSYNILFKILFFMHV